MSDLHNHPKQGSSISTLVLVTVIILGLLYFLAKACTNHSANEPSPSTHGSAQNITSSMPLSQS